MGTVKYPHQKNGNTWVLASTRSKDGSDGGIWQKVSEY